MLTAMTRLLLLSTSTVFGSGYLEYCADAVREHLGPAEQVEVVHAVSRPLPRGRKAERARRVFVPAQRTVQRHQAIDKQEQCLHR